MSCQPVAVRRTGGGFIESDCKHSGRAEETTGSCGNMFAFVLINASAVQL